MFFRQKRSGNHVYLQIVENRWEKGRSKQRVIATVGRLDQLRESGQLDGLLQSGAKFAEAVIRGHVFCSFLALLLRKELLDRLEAQGEKLEWAKLLRDLEALQYTEVESQAKRFLLRSDLAETSAAVFRAAGMAIPPTIQSHQE